MNLTVAKCCAHDVVTIDKTCSVKDAAKLMTEAHIGSVIILKDGLPGAIVTERDFLTKVVAQGLDFDSTTIEEIMTSAPLVVRMEDLITDVLRMMVAAKVRHMPVVDDVALVGVLSMRDVAYALDTEAQLKTGT